MADRLYIVVREDLCHAQQAVQGMHAFRLFVAEHEEVERAWYANSNTLSFLSVPGAEALADLLDHAEARGLRASVFHEPDLGDDVATAAAFEPRAKSLLRDLPRALGGR